MKESLGETRVESWRNAGIELKGIDGRSKRKRKRKKKKKKLKLMMDEGKLAEVKRIDLAFKIFHIKLLVARAKEFQNEKYKADNSESYFRVD
ncbi:unnamed protein product [Blepharisma stoltei]|uniref:Uncharacterized protein n=1 Tax=Blepharisma stoltei TaxID=1481888 RepID=A0AAU9IZ25_9CILI|nr:unnamed protein product [Blepharisma stoltei]